MVCFSCGSDKIVHVVADGDLVCVSCGTVQEGHVIDDTYWGNAKYCDEMEQMPCTYTIEEPFNPSKEIFKKGV